MGIWARKGVNRTGGGRVLLITKDFLKKSANKKGIPYANSPRKVRKKDGERWKKGS